MKTPETARAPETPLGRDILFAARTHLAGRKGLIALAALIVTAGAALNWSWLVAAGVAPLLLSALPCLAMCALGLCMNKMTGKSCSAGTDTARNAAPAGPSPPRILPAVAADVERIEQIRKAAARPEDPTAADGKTADFSQTPTPDERK